MNWLGIDVGGANLKISDGDRFAVARPLALWKHPDQLGAAIRELLAAAPVAAGLAVAMTGELADCFASKADGVRHILAAVDGAAVGRVLRVHLTDGRWVAVGQAIADPLSAAAANWHALAQFAGRYVASGRSLLIDIGSTTCDLVPLEDGVPRPAGRTDTTRMLHGELVYTGVERSPVCALVDRVPYRGQMCPVAQELFATARDVYLILEELPEQVDDTDTADGRPATRTAALLRLARLLCADRAEFDEADGVRMACAVADAQVDRIVAAMHRVLGRWPNPPDAILLSGHGDFLARRVLGECGLSVPVVSLAQMLGADVSRCATAYALAVLAREASLQ
jgi:probable H4MPT-linked C1 transfer pathway protein